MLGNRSNNFPLGIWKDQSVLLPSGNRTYWSLPIPREKYFDLHVLSAFLLNNCIIHHVSSLYAKLITFKLLNHRIKTRIKSQSILLFLIFHVLIFQYFIVYYAISAYQHWCCELESRSERDVQHYVIKFVSDLRQVDGVLRVLRFSPPIKLTATI